MLILVIVVCLFTSHYVTSAANCPSRCGQRMRKMTARIKQLEEARVNYQGRVDTLETQGSTTGSPGTVYTRWGRTVCPEGNTLLYDGGAASGHSGGHGGGADFLCLPREPQLDNVMEGVQTCGAFIYGAEYRGCLSGTWSRENNNDQSLGSYDMPCAVCNVPARQNHLMIPAMIDCPQGWTEEYQGFLSGELAGGAHRNEWICVDAAPETIPNTGVGKGGAGIFVTEIWCGALPCDIYPHGHEVSCVVCSK